jgi:hypothetical protein
MNEKRKKKERRKKKRRGGRRRSKKMSPPPLHRSGFAIALGRTRHEGPESRPYIKLYIHIFDKYRGTM